MTPKHTFPSALRLLKKPRHQRSGRLSLDGSSWRPPAHPHGPIRDLWDSAEIRRVIYLTQGGSKINKHNILTSLTSTMIYYDHLWSTFWQVIFEPPAACSHLCQPSNSGPLVALMSWASGLKSLPCQSVGTAPGKPWRLAVRCHSIVRVGALKGRRLVHDLRAHICNLSLIAQVKSINGISLSWNSVSRLVSPKPSTNICHPDYCIHVARTTAVLKGFEVQMPICRRRVPHLGPAHVKNAQ